MNDVLGGAIAALEVGRVEDAGDMTLRIASFAGTLLEGLGGVLKNPVQDGFVAVLPRGVGAGGHESFGRYVGRATYSSLLSALARSLSLS